MWGLLAQSQGGRQVAFEIVRVVHTKRPDRSRALVFAGAVVLGSIEGFSQRIRPALQLLMPSEALFALDRRVSIWEMKGQELR